MLFGLFVGIAFWAAENFIVETGNFVSWYKLYGDFEEWQENKFTKQIMSIPFLTFTRLFPDSMNLLKIQIYRGNKDRQRRVFGICLM
jgi:hypothetical protein